MNIAIIGPGLVGSAFISQIEQFQKKKTNLALRIVAITSSSKMILNQTTLSEFKQNKGEIADTTKFTAYCCANKPCVVVDCTSNQQIADSYSYWLNSGLHIITPNKKAFSSSMHTFNEIMGASKRAGVFVKHESSVGAGLPILSTLGDLIMTGDEIVEIQGIFSGTLSYIFNNFSAPGAKEPFSAVVAKANELGYTEPDPREDLNGMDVGRVAGSELELSTLAIENLVPDALRTKNTLDFMNDLPKFDAHFAALQDKATAKDCVLRYVGTVNGTKSRAGLEMFPTSHPFASLKGSDNIIAFKTKRFPNGLIVQGSGAGDQVTAFGMFSDLLKIATSVTQQPVSFS